MLQGCYASGSEVEADINKVLHSAIDKEAAGAHFTCFTGTNVLALLALLVKNYLFYAELHSTRGQQVLSLLLALLVHEYTYCPLRACCRRQGRATAATREATAPTREATDETREATAATREATAATAESRVY